MKKIQDFIILIFVLIITFSIVFQKLYKKEKVINLFGYSLLIVNTGSMEPTIKKGDLIIIKQMKKYKLKDIVTYIDEDGYCITHRIISKDNDNTITKGDFNNVNDEKIKDYQIKGKVIFYMNSILSFIIIQIIMTMIIFTILSRENEDAMEENKKCKKYKRKNK